VVKARRVLPIFVSGPRPHHRFVHEAGDWHTS
jgi:hypothetical protein